MLGARLIQRAIYIGEGEEEGWKGYLDIETPAQYVMWVMSFNDWVQYVLIDEGKIAGSNESSV